MWGLEFKTTASDQVSHQVETTWQTNVLCTLLPGSFSFELHHNNDVISNMVPTARVWLRQMAHRHVFNNVTTMTTVH